MFAQVAREWHGGGRVGGVEGKGECYYAIGAEGVGRGPTWNMVEIS